MTQFTLEPAERIAIVVLPGMDGSGLLLDEFCAELKRTYPVHLISYPVSPVGYDELTALVMSQLPEDKFVVIGESFSGPIAIEVALKCERTAGLVLASTFASSPLPPQVAAIVRCVTPSWIPDSVIVAALLGAQSSPELRTRLIEAVRALPTAVVRARALQVLGVDKRKQLAGVACPVLCLHGRFDRVVGRRHVEAISALRPECLVEWFDAPHMLLETHPFDAASAVDRFCRRR